MVKYLIHFLDDWQDFRLAEFSSLLLLQGLDPREVILQEDVQLLRGRGESESETQHFLVVNLPNDDSAYQILERAVLVRGIYELWASGDDFLRTVEELHTLVATASPESLSLSNWVDTAASWSVQLLSFGRSFNMSQQTSLRSHLSFLPFKGSVNISNADLKVVIIVDNSRFAKKQVEESMCMPPPVPCYIGRCVGLAIMRETQKKYSLKTRLYLGPTSLDDSLAFVLANMAGVQPGQIVYEPFIGTGSIAIACTHFGAFCFGSDIDPRVLRGDMQAGPATRVGNASIAAKDKKLDVFSNFRQYNLPLPELVRMDQHVLQRHFKLPRDRDSDGTDIADIGTETKLDRGRACNYLGYSGVFHAIVTDPPYGIRAGARKSGRKNELSYSIRSREDHIPATQHYAVEEVMLDLLHNAAVSLVEGGALVYLIPTTYDFAETDLPAHPCFATEEICHQSLSTRHGRRAVLLRKVRAYSPALVEQFCRYKEAVLAGDDAGFGQLMSKLERALSPAAFADDAVVKCVSACAGRRREGKERRKKEREEGKKESRQREKVPQPSTGASEEPSLNG